MVPGSSLHTDIQTPTASPYNQRLQSILHIQSRLFALRGLGTTVHAGPGASVCVPGGLMGTAMDLKMEWFTERDGEGQCTSTQSRNQPTPVSDSEGGVWRTTTRRSSPRSEGASTSSCTCVPRLNPAVRHHVLTVCVVRTLGVESS